MVTFSASDSRRNRLSGQTSPYLLQHAANPVDWYPWGEAALAQARELDKPILLSIGYSACHWCHVMAHESFEDESTAAVMNELFVNIKVDREERPDLDKIYQLAHQMLTQRAGGWPLTMFLSPNDQRPFFGGTYFPASPRAGLPAFADLLRRVSAFYRARSDDIAQQSAALDEAFRLTLPEAVGGEVPLTLAPLAVAREKLAADFDPHYGGFSDAPKFPHPTSLEWLLRQWRRSAGGAAPDLHSLYMTALTLSRMAEGGLYDHIGGGFARYSVDRYWMIPHFEKMLYDNGQLLRLLAHAAAATGEALFYEASLDTAQWIMREMQSPDGAYWSSLDADSEGEEGRFYVWEAREIQSLVPAESYPLFSKRFGLDRAPNFEGRWHLHGYRAIDDVAAELGLRPAAAKQVLSAARRILLDVRSRRVWPNRDEKVLTSWNALAIAGMAAAGRALQRDDLTASALRAMDFIRAHLIRDGRLLAVYKDGSAPLFAYLDDYAFTLDALIELLQSQWRSEDLRLAVSLADALLDHFEDRDAGGFYFTADDHEPLMLRPKSFMDEAMPAGNAIAAQALTRIGLLLGNARYLDAAARTIRAGWRGLERFPHAHTGLLTALEEHLEPPEIVLVRGSVAEASAWRKALEIAYAPHRLVFAIPDDAAGLPEAIANKKPRESTTAYVCRGTVCSAPIDSLTALLALTDGGKPER